LYDKTPTLCFRCERRRSDRVVERFQRRDRLATVVPPRYRKARLCHIARPLRERLLAAVEGDGAIVFGPPGVGKTYAVCALSRWLLFRPKRPLHVIRVRWEDVLLTIRSAFGSRERTESDVIAMYVKTHILAIDDVGASSGPDATETAFVTRIFTSILDARIEACRPTIIATNKRPGDLGESFDARVASRLQLLDQIGIGGRDQRRR